MRLTASIASMAAFDSSRPPGARVIAIRRAWRIPILRPADHAAQLLRFSRACRRRDPRRLESYALSEDRLRSSEAPADPPRKAIAAPRLGQIEDAAIFLAEVR